MKELAPIDALPEWWRHPRWLDSGAKRPPKSKAAPKSQTERAAPIVPVSVPFVMDAAARERSLVVPPAYGLVYTFEPTVFIGAVAELPLSEETRARWGSHPFWFLREELEKSYTIFEKHPESAERANDSEDVVSMVGGLAEPAIFSLIESHIGTTDSLMSGFHADLDVPTAIAAFEADGFRIVRLSEWPPRRGPARPHGDARFSRGLTQPSSRFHNGVVYEVERLEDGSERHTRLGDVASIFDAMTDEPLIAVLPKMPKKAGGVASARYLAARFGGSAHESEALRAAARLGGLDALEAFAAEGVASTALALPYAEELGTKRLATSARRWLRAHPRHAVAGLVSPALEGNADALAGLRLLAASHESDVLRLAALHGPQALAQLSALLLEDGFADVPKKVPNLPAFAAAALHPPLLLANGEALPERATEHLLTMFLFSRPEAPYSGALAARALLDPRSADAFAVSLFTAWQRGALRDGEWVLLAVGCLGGDDAARQLVARVKVWPSEKAHAWAVSGIDALARMNSDLSLTYLNGLAQKSKFPALREKARQRMAELAELRGFTSEELADRLVPDLDLDESGSRVLDFGARSFRVVFDEALNPRLMNEAGKVLTTLPKPIAADDAEKAADAAAQWKALKADGKTIAQQQIGRLEQMMCEERRLAPEAFRTLFVAHPLVRHLTRRLLWGTYDARGLRACFRVAEDGTYADEGDSGFVVEEGLSVGLVHPLALSPEAVSGWTERFGDYQLLQPFQQLARSTYALTDAEKRETRIVRSFVTKLGQVLALEKRGWQKGPAQDGGWVQRLERRLPSQRVAYLPLGTSTADGGICMGWMEGTPKEQRITGITLHERAQGVDRPVPWAELSAITASELLGDLASLQA